MSNVVPASTKQADSPVFLGKLCNVTLNSLEIDRLTDPLLESALFSWAEETLSSEDAASLRTQLSRDAMEKAHDSGKKVLYFLYGDPLDSSLSHKLTVRFMEDDESRSLLCVFSLADVLKTAPVSSSDPEPWKAVLRGYILFLRFDLSSGVINRGDLLTDVKDSGRTWSFPITYDLFLHKLAEAYVRPAWTDEFLSAFSETNLKKQIGKKKQLFRRSFSSDTMTCRLDVFLPEGDDSLCYLGLCVIEPEEQTQLIVSQNSDGAARAALEDLRLEMQMERDETRKKHHRFSFWLALIAIVAGIAGGAVMDRKIPEFSALLTSILPSEETATATPVATPAPIEEVSVPETVRTYVAFTNPVSFTAEIMDNGTPRINTSSEHYSTVSFTAQIKDILDADWFEKQYARRGYYLDGTENAISFTLSYAEEENIPSSVIPQDAFEILVLDENGQILTGYQLMDEAMGGKFQASLSSGKTVTFFKRFNGTPSYLMLTFYQEGVRHELLFCLRYDDPLAEYPDLKLGDSGPFVLAMKSSLASLDYLTERQASVNRFDQLTEKAVLSAQKSFGIEQTGIADTAFLQKLFSETSTTD